MGRRILSLIAASLIIAPVITSCGGGGEPTITETPPSGTVAQLPEDTPTPTLTPTPTPTPSPTPSPTPTSTPTPTPTPEPTETPNPTPTPTPPSTPVKILTITGGEVLVKRAGTDTWIQAKIEMVLKPGDTIKTGAYGKTEITFFEGSTIELEDATEITIAELGISESGSTKVSLTQTLGKTVSRVKKLVDAESSFDIETPAAIAAVRGSVMLVSVASNGRTIVGNEHGDIRIIVAETEYTISEGFQRSITPGQPPSAEMPIPPTGGYPPPPPPPQARLNVTVQASPLEAHIGDVIIYTCSLHNSGDLSFSNISASSNVSGISRNATYQSGDNNENSLLDPSETWLLTATYTVLASDYPQVTATANISATTSTGITLVDIETVTTPVVPVFITGPPDGATVNLRTIAVSGMILDPAFNTGTVSVNGGTAAPIAVVEGTFTGNATLVNGENAITVTITNGEQTASDSITVNLNPYAIRIELTWNTDNSTDLDAHFIQPGSVLTTRSAIATMAIRTPTGASRM